MRQEMRAKHGDHFVEAADAVAVQLPPLTDDQKRTLRGLFTTSARTKRTA